MPTNSRPSCIIVPIVVIQRRKASCSSGNLSNDSDPLQAKRHNVPDVESKRTVTIGNSTRRWRAVLAIERQLLPLDAEVRGTEFTVDDVVGHRVLCPAPEQWSTDQSAGSKREQQWVANRQ